MGHELVNSAPIANTGMRKKLAYVGAIGTAVILLDQWTKLLILERFYLHESIPIIPGFFHLTYVRNTGAAFGFLAQADATWRLPFFLIVPVIALIVLYLFLRKVPQHAMSLIVAVALVMGGAIGNLIDRARFGYVVDFLDFHWQHTYHFPAFNVADSAICIGAGLLMLRASKED